MGVPVSVFAGGAYCMASMSMVRLAGGASLHREALHPACKFSRPLHRRGGARARRAAGCQAVPHASSALRRLRRIIMRRSTTDRPPCSSPALLPCSSPLPPLQVLLNKIALSSFAFSSANSLLFFQCFLCVVAVKTCAALGLVKTEPFKARRRCCCCRCRCRAAVRQLGGSLSARCASPTRRACFPLLRLPPHRSAGRDRAHLAAGQRDFCGHDRHLLLGAPLPQRRHGHRWVRLLVAGGWWWMQLGRAGPALCLLACRAAAAPRRLLPGTCAPPVRRPPACLPLTPPAPASAAARGALPCLQCSRT